jgi:hypothetical protein
LGIWGFGNWVCLGFGGSWDLGIWGFGDLGYFGYVGFRDLGIWDLGIWGFGDVGFGDSCAPIPYVLRYHTRIEGHTIPQLRIFLAPDM